MMSIIEDARSFSWLLERFVDQTAGVTDAVAVSSDGLLMAMSSSLDRAQAEQVGAIISGPRQPRPRGVGVLRLRRPRADDRGHAPRACCSVGSISDGSCHRRRRPQGLRHRLVGYQMTLLVERAGAVLTPALVDRAQARDAGAR